jgi:hypothetical protein
MDLFAVATKLLGLVSDQLTAQGIVVPQRVCVVPGSDIAFDCEQLVVNVARVLSNYQGADSNFPVQTHSILRKSVEMNVTLCRCVPAMEEDGTAPVVSKMNAAANVTINDLLGLRVAIENIEHKHLLVPRNVPVTLGPATSIGPLGGIAGSQVMYSMEIVNNTDGWVG